MKKAVIKIIDFKKTKHIDKSFKDCIGLYDRDKDIIYIDRHTEELSMPSRTNVIWHEKGHRLVTKAKIHLPSEVEEAFCDLYAILKTPNKDLGALRKHIKKLIMNGHSWKRNTYAIYRRMFKFLDFDIAQPELNALLGKL